MGCIGQVHAASGIEALRKHHSQEPPQPEEHRFHDEPQTGHGHPIGHPVDKEPDSTVFPCEVNQECQADEREMKRDPKVSCIARQPPRPVSSLVTVYDEARRDDGVTYRAMALES